MGCKVHSLVFSFCSTVTPAPLQITGFAGTALPGHLRQGGTREAWGIGRWWTSGGSKGALFLTAAAHYDRLPEALDVRGLELIGPAGGVGDEPHLRPQLRGRPHEGPTQGVAAGAVSPAQVIDICG